MIRNRLRTAPIVVQLVWVTLAVALVGALFEGRWSLAFVAATTFVLSLLPVFFIRRFGIDLPVSFVAWIVIFIFATIFLGEAFDFYTRYWWWDVVLHGGAAMGFGLVGFLFVFMLFKGDRYAAPAWAMAAIAFCVAVTIGSLWELFEFGMDSTFGTTMLKSGLRDTMWDLILNVCGASIGAAAGFFFLKGRDLGGLGSVIADFVARNRKLFRRRPRN